MTTNLEESVMIRVRTIHLVKYFTQPHFIRYGLLCMFSIVLITSVDVVSIIANIVTTIEANGNPLYFLISAFGESLWIVKSLIVLEAGLVLFSIKDVWPKKLSPRLPRLSALRRLA